METVLNPIQACKDVFIKPNRVFATIKVRENWSWFPFIIVVVMGILPTYLYFHQVDFDWYKNVVVNASLQNVSPAERKAMFDQLTLENTQFFTIVGISFSYVIVNAILAIYLHLATKSDAENVQGFSDWYGFTWWTSMPVVFASVASLLVLLIAGSPQLAPDTLHITSLAWWVGSEQGDAMYNLLSSLRLESLWSIYLIAVGISQWTRISARNAFIIASVPFAVVWVVWALFF